MKIRKTIAVAAATVLVTLSMTACVGGKDWQAKRAEWENSVVLINAFEVPRGKEAEALASWRKSRDFLKEQPGYIGTRLHRNIDPDGKFHLVNVARWRSAADFKAATERMREAMPDSQVEGVRFYPGLFNVIESDMPGPRFFGK